MTRSCEFMGYHYDAVASEPGYAQERRLIESRQILAPTARLPGVVTIPVVVHVVEHPDQAKVTDAQIAAQIAVLNADFRGTNADRANLPEAFRTLADDCRIEFRLARRDPLGRPTTGITRTRTATRTFPAAPVPAGRPRSPAIDAELKVAGTGATAWPRDDYLNIWVCNMGRRPLGYAAFPGSAAWRDGVVIDYTCFGTGGTAQAPYDLGRTATHEVGHWLDLLHIWGDDDGGCDKSDNVSDTPNQANSNGGTPAFPSVSCGNAPNGDLFMNYMDYVDDVAMFMFTAGQVDRMHAALAGARRSILQSRGLADPEPNAAATATGGLEEAFATALASELGRSPELVFDGVGWVRPEELQPPF